MTNFVKVLKNEEASNVLINEIEFVSKKMETVDIKVLNNLEKNAKEIQASLDDLSRTIFETINYCNQNIKVDNKVNSSYKAKGLMYNILESSINTKLMIDGINEVNELLCTESVDSLIKIKINVDRVLTSLDYLLKNIKEIIDDRNFNPVDFVENLLNSYIVKPNKEVTKKNTLESKEKENMEIKKEKESVFNEKIIICLDCLEKICQKYQFDISIYNLNEVRKSILTDESKNEEYIAYFQYIFYSILSQNVKIEIKDKINFENKLADAINFERNFHRENSRLSEGKTNNFRDENDFLNTKSFKSRSFLDFV